MTWSITAIKTGEGVVASVSVTDGTSTVASDTKLDEVSAESVGSMTEEQFVALVKSALGEQQVAVYEAMVAGKTNAVEPEVVPLRGKITNAPPISNRPRWRRRIHRLCQPDEPGVVAGRRAPTIGEHAAGPRHGQDA